MAKSADSTAELQMPLWKANCWFAVLWGMLFFDMVDRYTLAACLPYIKQTFQLTDAQSGVIASAFSIAIVAAVIPVSLIAHKWSRRKVCSIMVAVWSIATWATGFAKGYGALFASRLGIGAGEAGYLPVSMALISAWYPKDKRGVMIGWLQSAVSAGATVGLMLAGWLAYTYGWRACFGIVAVPGFILAVLGWFMPDFKNDVSQS
jgi:MFS family permease